MMSNKAARFLLAAFLVLVMCVAANTASASPEDTVPNVNREMMTPGFWIGKLTEPDKVIVTPDEIASFNKEIILKLPDLVYDLVAYPASLDSQQLLKLLNKRPFPEEDRYMNGRKVDGPYYDNLKNQMNLAAVKEQ